MELKQNLLDLVNRFKEAKSKGRLNNASEETIRSWINEMLSVFGWNVQDTNQILQEKNLDKDKRKRLKGIGSTNVRPDYTLVNGNVLLSFLDAKSLEVNIERAQDAAFQIRSYGWSIGASFSIVTNMEQIAIYDCSEMPHVDDDTSIARVLYYTCDEYIEHVEKLESFMRRDNVISKQCHIIHKGEESLDKRFSQMLGDVRVDLAKSIMESNNDIGLEAISSFVQIIINRILFIRVCESRGLEENGLLKQYAETDFWKEFKNSSYFKFYEHYDGPMFKRVSEIQKLNIDNGVFMRLLAHLYYPSPYRFDVIPLKTISDMYDLFLGYRLLMKGGKICNELKTEFKKSNGAVTTPKNIVNKVIECTIPNKVVEQMSVKEIFQIKVLDPACGSGVFLVGAYDYLGSHILNKVTLHPEEYPDILLFDKKGKPMLTVEGRKEIINRCIYGVDINPEAIEVTKMSLSLKIIDNYNPEYFESAGIYGTKILKGIGENIKCGNTLVDVDILERVPSIADDVEEYSNMNVFSWTDNFPAIMKNGGFDYVVGNPPYVEVKNYNVNLPSMAKYIKNKYYSCKKGKVDLAMPFIEKGIALLNSHGRMGYIVQKRFFKTEYGEALRNGIAKDNLLLSIYDYTETGLFDGVVTYVAVLVCGKNTTNTVEYSNSIGHTYDIPKSYIDKTPWNFDNPELWQLTKRLSKQYGSLEDICSVRVGIQVLWGEAYQIKSATIKDGIVYGKSGLDENVAIEVDACRPLLCNERIMPFLQPSYSTYVLFPYEVKESTARRISFSEYKNLYPKAAEYLERHKTTILSNVQIQPDRECGLDRNEYWHVFTRESHLEDEYRKVCVPMTSKEPVATCLSNSKVYCDNANMFYLRFCNETEEKRYAIAAVINSTPFSTMARMYANPQQNGYFKFSRQFLNPVPYPCKAFEENVPEIKELSRIGISVDKILQHIALAPIGKGNLNSLLSHYFKRMDEICCNLYGINGKDRELLMTHKREDRN